MKSIVTICASIFLFGGMAKADPILIYKGSENQRTNLGANRIRSYFVVFDLTTHEDVAIEYGGYTINGISTYYYSVGVDTPFVYVPVTVGSNTSDTYLASGKTYQGSTFAQKFTMFAGRNSQLSLGGSVSGEYPAALSYVNYDHAGDGTVPGDTVLGDVGTYDLAVGMTRESNDSNDDLDTAVGIVTGLLESEGHAQE
jgi:hypothetical protein